MDDHINMNNIDNLTEEELKILEQRYKEQNLPTHRLLLLVPFNIITAAGTMYYTVNFKYYSKKLFNPKQFGFREIIKYGTLQSIVFTAFYLTGTAILSGVYNPIGYMRGLAQIKGRQIDTAIKFDQTFQKHFLFNILDFFGISENIANQVKNELNQQRDTLEKQNYFSQETKKLIDKDLDEE